MKAKTKRLLTLLLLVAGVSLQVQAQKAKKGNGKIITEKIAVDQFFKIELQAYCNVKIQCGAMSMVELSLDENLYEYVDVNVIDGTLQLKTEQWIEASTISLTIQVPFITSFKTSGWGNIEISELNTESFSLDGNTGNITLDGEVSDLSIKAGTGNISALNLKAKNVTIEKMGSGHISIYATEKLNVNGSHGSLIYKGNPEIVENPTNEDVTITSVNEVMPAGPDPTYITLKVRNNRAKKSDFFIRGPKEQHFSYGFAMGPYFTRQERVPVGTKIWEDNMVGRVLLLEIKEDDAGKTINLFQK